MKSILFLMAFVGAGLFSRAQSFDKNYRFLSGGDILQDKNFYLFTLLQQLPQARQLILDEPICQAIGRQKRQALTALLSASGGLNEMAKDIQNLRFSTEENRQLREALAKAVDGTTLVWQQMRPSGYFIRYDGETSDQVLTSALEDALKGINNIIDVYGLGIKGRDSEIDSATSTIQAPSQGENFLSLLRDNVKNVQDRNVLFFEPSLTAAMLFLRWNNRDEPARYEPLDQGANKKAYASIPNTDWSNFEYAAIVVPGNGPKGNESLSYHAKERLKTAVERYDRGMAPFIIVTGGNVHPFQTPYTEAIEMKKELMRWHHVPESDIIIEPYARHTTTNIRNANRMLYRQQFPIGKKVLIVTDKKQAGKISHAKFSDRCKKDIGYQPFFYLRRISDTDLEYIPAIQSLFMDSSDPLDP